MKLWPNFAPVQNRISGVKTHHLRGRDAEHFGRWLDARSDVIRSASLRVAAKIAAGFAEGLDRIPRYALRPSPARQAILAATRLAEIMSFHLRNATTRGDEGQCLRNHR